MRCRELKPVARQLTALLKLLDIFSLTGIECTTFMVFFVPVYTVLSDNYSVSYSSDVLIFTVAYPPVADRPCRNLHGSRTSLREKQGIELVPGTHQNGSPTHRPQANFQRIVSMPLRRITFNKASAAPVGRFTPRSNCDTYPGVKFK